MYREILYLVGLNFLDTPGDPLIRRIMSFGDVSRNFGLGRIKFSPQTWRPLIRRIMSSGDVSSNFGLGRLKFSRQV